MVKRPNISGLFCVVSLLDSVSDSCHFTSPCVVTSSPESIGQLLPSCCQTFHLCHTHSSVPVCHSFFLCASSSKGQRSFRLSPCHPQTSESLFSPLLDISYLFYCVQKEFLSLLSISLHLSYRSSSLPGHTNCCQQGVKKKRKNPCVHPSELLYL